MFEETNRLQKENEELKFSLNNICQTNIDTQKSLKIQIEKNSNLNNKIKKLDKNFEEINIKLSNMKQENEFLIKENKKIKSTNYVSNKWFTTT